MEHVLPDAIDDPASAEASVAQDKKPGSIFQGKLPSLLLLVAMLIVPLLFVKQVWFGSHLSDEGIILRLTSPKNSRDVQHACEQISQRMRTSPEDAEIFYSLLVKQSENEDANIRSAIAWCMGEDNTRPPELHAALSRLLTDKTPYVRYNAAFALVRYNDSIARPVLREMLQPYIVHAHWDDSSDEAEVIDTVHSGLAVNGQMRIALVRTQNNSIPLLTELAGQVTEVHIHPGDRVHKGDPVCDITPTAHQVWETLRALSIIGEPDDLEYIKPYVTPRPASYTVNERTHLKTQAELTVLSINDRSRTMKEVSNQSSQAVKAVK